jgi:hypothetical protein
MFSAPRGIHVVSKLLADVGVDTFSGENLSSAA